ncbi:hypothetical protein [Haloarcula sp. CGMCC 1.2071]|uniref:hypothetical protein n=1 Tax=Haloarcula sp. CGMCC 1.2071 TaxID=3111454 RepID=UPI00300F1BCC
MLTEKNVSGDMGASVYILYFAAKHGLSFDEVEINVDYDVEDPNTIPAVIHGQILIRTLFRVSKTINRFSCSQSRGCCWHSSVWDLATGRY